ncbi:MAG: DUF6671 family protein [Cyanobacteria bacterium P01_H01_bin.121]
MQNTIQFEGQTVVLATMHQKEKAISPILADAFQIHVEVPVDFNTDQFGTFTRDIPRAGSQIEAARAKAIAALANSEHQLAIASEGAFFPHPELSWLACNRELVLLLDQRHELEPKLEIIGEHITTDTSFAHQAVTSIEQALQFAQKVGFPQQGLVAMPRPDTQVPELIYKGIRDRASLEMTVQELLQRSDTGKIHLETDMRAMHSPKRMQAIAQATKNLVAAMASTCPKCNLPGFAIVEHIPGLPCELCGQPTQRIQADVYRCHKCHYRKVIARAANPLASPAECSFCNP